MKHPRKHDPFRTFFGQKIDRTGHRLGVPVPFVANRDREPAFTGCGRIGKVPAHIAEHEFPRLGFVKKPLVVTTYTVKIGAPVGADIARKQAQKPFQITVAVTADKRGQKLVNVLL